MIKALFLDIDGTLMSFATHQVPASTIEALAQARARGVRIFIATGRATLLINNLGELQRRGLIDGYVTVNGSYCTIGQQVVYKGAMPPEDVRAMLDFCTTRQCPCIVVGEHDLCVCNHRPIVDELFHDFLKVDYLPHRTVEEALQMGDIFQLTPFIDVEQEREIMSRLPGCESGRWYPAFTDVTARGNNKQKGIDEIIRPLGLSLEETMAFGDGGNDIPMLRHAGIGVAMGNAQDDVKASADYVTASVDEDGIRKALQHFAVI